MKLLLDTHILLWALNDSTELSEAHRELIGSEHNIVFVSRISSWEIVIKAGLGKLSIPNDLFESIETFGYEYLELNDVHLKHYLTLPLLHRDPFDRMLVTQAQVENLTLLSVDSKIKQYEVGVI